MGKEISNDLVVLVIGTILVCSLFVAPEADWLGNFQLCGISGLIGHLTGKASK